MSVSIHILIDRSGSMATKWSDAIGAVNTYVEKLEDPEARVQVSVFDAKEFNSGLSFDRVRSNAQPWTAIDAAEVSPRGGTPLLDAIGRLYRDVAEDPAQRGVVVIMTDGQENASKEINKAVAKGMLDKVRERGWQVVHLGADFDAYGQGTQLGTKVDSILNVAPSKMGYAAETLSTKTRSYAATGQSMSFTAEEKAEASKPN
jgi:Mg-chelatase subunit ChlD